MTLLIDPPNSPGHGRLWSHLASDESFDELHRFTDTFDRLDHESALTNDQRCALGPPGSDVGED